VSQENKNMENPNFMIALLVLEDYFREADQRREQRALRDAQNPRPDDEREESLLRRIVRRLRAAAALPTPLAHIPGRAPMH
jgi:hypothetical protein